MHVTLNQSTKINRHMKQIYFLGRACVEPIQASHGNGLQPEGQAPKCRFVNPDLGLSEKIGGVLSAAQAYQQGQNEVDNVDKLFRFLAPVLFLLFNVLYWSIYLVVL